MASEREKMLAGERYNIFDRDLEERRREVEALIRRFNLAESEPERRTILEQVLGHIGRGAVLPDYGCLNPWKRQCSRARVNGNSSRQGGN